jgi:hypothetical protein
MLYRLPILSSHPILYHLILSYPTVKCSSPTDATASMSEHNHMSDESLLKTPQPQDSPPPPPTTPTPTPTITPTTPSPKQPYHKSPKQPQGVSVSAKGDFRKEEWKVPQGYSSGASSFSGSEASFDSDNEQDVNGAFARRASMEVSRHSDILDLSSLRQEMMAEGDLTKTVVRIEVRNTSTMLLILVHPTKRKCSY